MVGAGTCAVVCQACHSNKCHKVTQWERFFSAHKCLDVYQLCAVRSNCLCRLAAGLAGQLRWLLYTSSVCAVLWQY